MSYQRTTLKKLIVDYVQLQQIFKTFKAEYLVELKLLGELEGGVDREPFVEKIYGYNRINYCM